MRSRRPRRRRSKHRSRANRSPRNRPLLKSPSSPITVAITGGIGAGKTEALRAFERHCAATSSSDEIVHRLLRGDPEVHEALRARWGEEIVGEDSADRAAIAKIVFNDPDELAWLEALLHPKVVQEYLAWREMQTARLLVTEVPLLYETGGETRFDKVVVITAPQQVRAVRTNVKDDAREQRLIPDEEKLRRADFTYVNDRGLEELDAFVADVVAKLLQ